MTSVGVDHCRKGRDGRVLQRVYRRTYSSFSLSVNWIDRNIHFRCGILTMLLTVAAKQAYIGGLLPRVGS